MQKSPNILSVLLFSFFVLQLNISFSSYFIFAQELDWKHTGGPMGGIIGGMDISSNGDIYAGVYPFMIQYSGLFKSTDDGKSWNRIESQFDDFEVYSIHITKENIVWVGTTYQGRIYRSTDNGISWQNKANGFGGNECWAIGESKEGTLFASDVNWGGLYRSTNNGDNW